MRLDFENVELHVDSQVMVKMTMGDYSVSLSCQSLIRRTRSLINQIGKLTYVQIWVVIWNRNILNIGGEKKHESFLGSNAPLLLKNIKKEKQKTWNKYHTQ